LEIGSVVKALAGRDCGRYFVIVETHERFVMIADGVTRKLQKPKKKNIRHLESTCKKLKLDNLSNKKLKIVLGEMSGTP